MKTNTRITLFILFFTALGQSAIDIYLPSLPDMVTELNTSNSLIQLSLTTFLVGFACSQLVYGPMSDNYGRKPLILVGLSLFLLGSVFCIVATNILSFNIARLIQGLGIGAASTISRALLRDVFNGKDLARTSSYIAMSWACVPIFAPLLGSYIQYYSSWRCNFVLLALVTLLSLLMIIKYLPETRKIEQQCQASSAVSIYGQLLNDRRFIRYILCVMLFYGAFIYINMSGPFLIQVFFGQTIIDYGWKMVFIASGYLIGSFLSGRLLSHFTGTQLLSAGILGFLLTSILLVFCSLMASGSLWALIIPLFFTFLSVGFAYPQLIALTLSPFGHIAGSVGALFGFMTFVGGTLASFVVSYVSESNTLPFCLLMLAHALLVALIYRYFRA